jgi:hypothetical protein
VGNVAVIENGRREIQLAREPVGALALGDLTGTAQYHRNVEKPFELERSLLYHLVVAHHITVIGEEDYHGKF